MSRAASKYPTPSAYQEALQFPQTAFADPELAAGEVRTNALGLPQPITGAFAAVFPVSTAAGRYAVRCFLTRVERQQRRYRAVAEHLAAADLPYTVAFDYQPEGVRVGVEPYPLLKMAWVEGEGLAAWVERHLDDPEALRTLAEAWRRLLRVLAAAAVAHGDLQHGNVLVTDGEGGPRLRLVDYDTVWVPALKGETAPEVGHRNYQHPDRTEADFGPELDHFPGLVIYTALQALAEQPELWARFSTGENLLFQAGDFYDPKASPLFDALRALPPVRPLAEVLETACYLEPAAVPGLEEVLGGEAPRPRGRRKRRRKREGRPERRAPFEAVALPLTLGALGVVAVLLVVAPWWAALGVAVGATGVLGWQGRRSYAALSVVRRRRRLRREADVLRRWIAELEDARAELRRERRAFLQSLDTYRRDRLREIQDAALRNHLRHRFINELDHVEEIGHRAVVRLKGVGVRNAFHATPERVAAAKGLSTETRERVNAWRAALAAEHADAVPEALSPAEEQRLQRQIERRLEGIDGEAARVAAKADVQRAELDRVEAQVDALPAFGPRDYAGYLLRLRPLPAVHAPAPAAPILQQPHRARPPAPPPEPERAWWEQA